MNDATQVGRQLAGATETVWILAPRFEERARARRLRLSALAATVLLAGASLLRNPAATNTEPLATATVSLLDGSTIEPMDGAEIAVERDSLDATVVTLRSGRARFDVTHRPARSFEVHAGPAVVRVLGTQFEVTLIDDRAVVRVEHGRVAVERAVLLDGQSLAIERARNPQPAPRLSSQRPHLPDLLELADAARAARDFTAARSLLERYLARHPHDERTAEAAFALGKVHLELGNETEAVRAFRMVWERAPSSPLAEPARAREREHDHAPR